MWAHAGRVGLFTPPYSQLKLGASTVIRMSLSELFEAASGSSQLAFTLIELRSRRLPILASQCTKLAALHETAPMQEYAEFARVLTADDVLKMKNTLQAAPTSRH